MESTCLELQSIVDDSLMDVNSHGLDTDLTCPPGLIIGNANLFGSPETTVRCKMWKGQEYLVSENGLAITNPTCLPATCNCDKNQRNV